MGSFINLTVKISNQTSRQAKTNISILPGEPQSNYRAANHIEVRFIWRNRLKKRAKGDVYLKETENLDSFLCHIVAVSLQTFFPSTSQSLEGFRTDNFGALWNPLDFFPKYNLMFIYLFLFLYKFNFFWILFFTIYIFLDSGFLVLNNYI